MLRGPSVGASWWLVTLVGEALLLRGKIIRWATALELLFPLVRDLQRLALGAGLEILKGLRSFIRYTLDLGFGRLEGLHSRVLALELTSEILDTEGFNVRGGDFAEALPLEIMLEGVLSMILE